jgi:hypothetical protein
MSRRAITHLSSDPVMSTLIEKVGPIRLRPMRLSPFQSLTQAAKFFCRALNVTEARLITRSQSGKPD